MAADQAVRDGPGLDAGARTSPTLLKERGVRSWALGDENETPEQRAARETHLRQMAQATGPRTTSVDVSAVLADKIAALREHVTQMAADSWFLSLTLDDWQRFGPTEDFTLRVSHVGVRIPEDDLFAGL